MSNPTWDLNISIHNFKKILRHSGDRRFLEFFTRVLCRVPFYEAFHGYITPKQFKSYYPKVRRRLSADLLGIGRMSFWDWLYKKLSRD